MKSFIAWMFKPSQINRDNSQYLVQNIIYNVWYRMY